MLQAAVLPPEYVTPELRRQILDCLVKEERTHEERIQKRGGESGRPLKEEERVSHRRESALCIQVCHAKNTIAARISQFSILGFWGKNIMAHAGIMPFHRDFTATTRSRLL